MLQPGQTVCWRAHAPHVAVLVDGAAYFEALTRALLRATRSVFIIGWDIDTRVRLARGFSGTYPEQLGAFLDVLVRRQRRLHVRILSWDYSFVYLFEREPLPHLKFDAKTHRRVHFELDGDHPPFAAHHQKIVVIDDALAFSGGLDLCDHRWDTVRHEAHDPERVTIHGQPYAPFHDAQVLCDGEAARALSNIARERWRSATGERVPILARGAHSWPAEVPADLEEVEVGLSRSGAAHHDRPEIREVETLYVDSIAAARRSIYIESQYFTSRRIADALVSRLGEHDPPEVVVISPRVGDGWIESQTVGAAHAQTVARLQVADHRGRLRIACAVVPGGDSGESLPVFIHAKICIIDDRLLRVGSANLTNRSMGVDTECDVSVEAVAGDLRTEHAIARVRARLLAEHLGLSVDAAAESVAHQGLIRTIDQHALEARALRVVSYEDPGEPPSPTAMAFADPERPVSPSSVLHTLASDELQQRARSAYLRLAALLAVLVGVVVVWRLTPLAQLLDVDPITAWARSWRARPGSPLFAILVFALAAQFLVPVNLLIIVVVLVYGPLLGSALAITGACSAAAVAYSLGGFLGGDLVRRLAGPRVIALKRGLASSGFLPVLVVRVLPVAPAQVVSMVAGAWRYRFRYFILATLVGTLPGVFALSILGDRLRALVQQPSPETILLLVGFALLMVALLLWLRSFLHRRGKRERERWL